MRAPSDTELSAVADPQAFTPTAAPQRLLVLDALRGLCFVVMTVDHFPGAPLSRFNNTYFGLFGFFTAALGFVFLSGLVGGIVYSHHLDSYGLRSLLGRIGRRIRDLYVTQLSVFLVLAVAVIVHVSGTGRSHLELVTSRPWKGIAFGAFLLYEPGYLGILPMYCFFLVLTPVLLWQLRKGNWRYVLPVSGFVWLLSGLVIGTPENPAGVDFGAFNPLAYQLLFVVGLIFGTGTLDVRRLSSRVRGRLAWLAISVSLIAFGLRMEYAFGGPVQHLIDAHREWFSAVGLGPIRLLSFASFALVLYFVARRVDWNSIEFASFRWLVLIGRYSLPVFAWSILVTYAADDFLPQGIDFGWRVLGTFVALASLTVPTHVRAWIGRHEVLREARVHERGVLLRGLRRTA